MRDKIIVMEANYALQKIGSIKNAKANRISTKSNTAIIKCINNKVYTDDINGNFRAHGAVQIMYGLEICLGINIDDYINIVEKTAMPITIKKINEGEYTINRNKTAYTEEIPIAKVNCSNGCVSTVVINNHVGFLSTYKDIIKTSALSRLKIRINDSIYSNIESIIKVIGIKYDRYDLLKTEKDNFCIDVYNSLNIKKRNNKSIKREEIVLFPIRIILSKKEIKTKGKLETYYFISSISNSTA